MRDLFRPGSHRALPLGSVIWSNPGSATVTSIVPAVPSASGVADVFAFQADGTVQAITSEGTTAWTANVSDGTNVVPDFAGGLVALEWNNGKGSVTKLDGKTGQRNPVYVPGGSWSLDPWDLAVHTDGTIFALQTNWDDWTVVGIDPTTGGQKFGVPVPIPAQAGGLCWGGVIVAGDGYAYVPFGWIADFAPDYMTNHLRVLRISSSGASDTIPISDWSSTFSELCAMHIGVITNADTGVALTWQSDPSMNVGPRMAITTGTSVSVMSGPVVPGQRSPVAPVLQAQDGSFVGTVWTTDGSQNMVAFDATGSVRWSVPNDQPQIATEDGGVIGQSGITYDQNGSATGQMGKLPTYSWLGNAYQRGSVLDLLARALKVAKSWWPFGGGNASANQAAVPHPPFAQLASCNDSTLHPPPACPGPKDAIFTAWYWLRQRLGDSTRASYLDSYVFMDETGAARKEFMAYLGRGDGPEFYDGPTSEVKLSDAVCAGPAGWTVQHYFQLSNNAIVCDVAAATCRLDPKKPLRTFFEPRAISLDNQGATDANIALEFHEALHGFKQKDDPQLQEFLGCTRGYSNTRDITFYLQQFISAQPLQSAPMDCKYIEQHRVPADLNVCVR